jgi:tetratricopeptide (TPR) repeat protein
MSPEQCAQGVAVDARSDVYSLACVVYEMLCGDAPFTGRNSQATVARHMYESPRSLRIARSTVSPQVDAAVRLALAKAPADRFRTPLAFAEALTKADLTVNDSLGSAPGTESAEARRYYLQGRLYWDRRFEGGVQKAIDCFRTALERDPTYARAYSGLADCFLALTTYEFLPPRDGLPMAVAAVQRGLELDDSVAETHCSRGLVAMYHHRWAEAEQSFKRSMALNPEYASAHQFYSMWLAAHGRINDAVAEARRAHELDPLQPVLSAAIGWTLYFGDRYREAIDALRTTLEVHPTFGVASGMLGQVLVEVGEFDSGISHLAESAKTFPPARAALGYAYGIAGRVAEAREKLAEVQRPSAQGYVSPYGPAIVCAGLNDADQAFEWLEKSREGRSFFMILAAVNPMFRRLRGDARFGALLGKMGLK